MWTIEGERKELPQPALRPVLPGMRVLLGVFSVLTLLGLNQLYVLSTHTNRLFAWTINPPLTAAFLGACFAAGCVLVLAALRTRTWAQARVAIYTILVFTAVTLLATLLHLDRFHFSAPGLIARFAAWFWLAVYVLVPATMIALLAGEHRAPGTDPPRRQPLPRWLAGALVLQGAVMLMVGMVLFIAPDTADTLWPWQLTALTARAVAGWLIAFGVAAGLALRERDLARLRISALAYTAFGVFELVALARYGDQVHWDRPATWVFLLVLATVPPTGAAGWWLERRGRPAV